MDGMWIEWGGSLLCAVGAGAIFKRGLRIGNDSMNEKNRNVIWCAIFRAGLRLKAVGPKGTSIGRPKMITVIKLENKMSETGMKKELADSKIHQVDRD